MEDKESRFGGMSEKNMERIRRLRLIDDEFMTVCFEDSIEATQLVLRIVLGKPDITVKSVRTQKRLKNLLGRDICLDIDATDSEGREYDIEIQREGKGAGRKRARYHSSMMDAELLESGRDFGDLPESYVIFITENDVLGQSLPCYNIERKIDGSGCPFGDGSHIVYVNGSDRDGSTDMGKLMQDFFCTDPGKMNYRELAERVRHYKENEGGVGIMGSVFDEIREEGREEGLEEGIAKGVEEGMAKGVEKGKVESNENTARKLLKIGEMSVEAIADLLDFSVERVMELAETVRS